MDDISVYILKPFPFSRNGIKEEQAEVSTTISIPGRLFDGLNREGYVRRADIGDGHFTLAPVPPAPAPAEPVLAQPAVAAPAATVAPVTPSASAPQPPVKTADLSGGEQAALADGSWRALKFFAKRSIAAKLSDEPIRNGEDADAAIEAYVAAAASAAENL